MTSYANRVLRLVDLHDWRALKGQPMAYLLKDRPSHVRRTVMALYRASMKAAK